MFGKYLEKHADKFYVVFRVIVGLLLAWHGASKFGLLGSTMTISGFAGFAGVPVWLGGLAALIELVGGLFIALGLWTRIAAALGGLVMIGAWILAHIPKGGLNPMANGGELALIYLVAMLVLLSQGARKYGLEKTLFGKEC